jgi:glutamate synthase (NADPH/NADH) large chain
VALPVRYVQQRRCPAAKDACSESVTFGSIDPINVATDSPVATCISGSIMSQHLPGKTGLYQPEFEHDACGVSFVVDLYGRKSNGLVAQGLTSLCNLEHRGATGAEQNTGDGAGILIQVPDAFLRAVVDFELPAEGAYAVGIAFLPQQPDELDAACKVIHEICEAQGLAVLGWRDVPVDPSMIGSSALQAMPTFRQLFVAEAAGNETGIALDRRAFLARKHIEHEILDSDGDQAVYFASLSARTMVYKGMLTTPQLGEFFLDLQDDRMESAIALVHSRCFPEGLRL